MLVLVLVSPQLVVLVALIEVGAVFDMEVTMIKSR